MKRIVIVFFTLLALTFAARFAWSAIDVYEFETDQQRQNYLNLIRELRCPKCQNQDIADSNAPIAQDMRREVHRMVLEGEEHDDVVNFMIERFGDFVTYKPRFDSSTLLLWLGPGVVVILGFIAVVAVSRKKKLADDSGNVGETGSIAAAQNDGDSKPQSGTDKQRVAELLDQFDDDANK